MLKYPRIQEMLLNSKAVINSESDTPLKLKPASPTRVQNQRYQLESSLNLNLTTNGELP